MGRTKGVVPIAMAFCVGIAFATCRDAPELFEPPALEPLGPAPFQLTFDPGRDVAPTWSASGDSILYVTERLVPPPGPPPDTIPPDTTRFGRPLRVIAFEGGLASKVFPNLQALDDGTLPIDYAVQSSDGRIAAFTLSALHPRPLCHPGTPLCDPPVVDSIPRLKTGFIRIRDPGSPSPPEADQVLTVTFPGREFDTSQHPGGLSGVWQTANYPFQRLFNALRRVPDHVSWAPEGDRIVFSDGIGLHVWSPATGDVSPIAGSIDGVNPAWSPTGEWIAFERYERGPLTEAVCEHHFPAGAGEPVLCVENRRTWPMLAQSVAIIRPDGSDLRVLSAGARPAWTPDGDRIYYESAGQIWSVGIDGAGATVVPNTENGYSPAVSPDGRWLAFARIEQTTAASNIWVVELMP